MSTGHSVSERYAGRIHSIITCKIKGVNMNGVIRDRYRKMKLVTTLLSISFIAYMVFTALYSLACILILTQGSLLTNGTMELTPGDWLGFGAGVLRFLAFWVSAVLFCIFSYRSVKNIEIYKPNWFDTGPVMSFVWYIVPIASLFKPYTVMKDIWRATFTPHDFVGDTPRLISLWWAAWICSFIVGSFSDFMTEASGANEGVLTEVALYHRALYFDLGASLLSLVCAWSIFKVFRQIGAKQDTKTNADIFD